MEGSVRVLPRYAYAGRGACFATASSSGSASVSGVANNNKGNKTSRKKGRQDDNPYQKTVLLPKTEFGMRANAKKREPELQEWWREKGIYEQLIKQNKGGTYTLHDGPPYANGDLHLGHAMNKVLKDIIVKHKLLKGHRASFVPGWDCHGLPIELKVLQQMNSKTRSSLTPQTLRSKARDFALKTIDSQAAQFKRYGVWGNWDDRYQTLDPAYEAAQLEVFSKMYLQGHIYRGLKPVHWSPSSRTALAEAELEYPAGHKSRSIYVSFEVEHVNEALRRVIAESGADADGCSFAVWTTTPWTIPANLAVSVNESIVYAVVRARESGKLLLVAQDLVQPLSEKLGMAFESTLGTIKGSDLAGCTYRHPLAGRVSPVVVGGDYITTESGTGLVHTAPGHGQEDFIVGQKYGLPMLSPVDGAGRLTKEAGEGLEGLNVLGDANEAIIKALDQAGALLFEELYEHKYPYDWRTKKPTIFRATEQWFASVDAFRKEALDAINGVQWVPPAGVKRITAMTSDRGDWCISRQRKWGVPIPAFYDKTTGEAVMTEEILKHVTEIVRKHGSDAWFELPSEDLLPESMRAEAGNLRKGEDTMDVWFDSGTSWAGVVSERSGLSYPADLYLEGSDQHRGWFQSSLLTSVAVNGHAPYKAVLTHGFVLDEKGNKMSKSLGNIIDPSTIIEGGSNAKKDPAYGADTLRLWVASVDYSSDVLIGPSILKQTSEIYRKVRGSLRFLLGNLHDFDHGRDAVAYEDLPAVDKYMLHLLASVRRDVDKSYESFQFNKVFLNVQRFNVADLSNFYLDVVKDRLYIRAAGSYERRSCQTVLKHVLDTMLPMIAPVLPHLAEDAWQNLPFKDIPESVFMGQGINSDDSDWLLDGSELLDTLSVLREVRGEVNKAIEAARNNKVVGSSLEAKVRVITESPQLKDLLSAFVVEDNNNVSSSNGVDELRYLFIVSQVEVSTGDVLDGAEEATAPEISKLGRIRVDVSKADGSKCARCWNYSTSVGTIDGHAEVCDRCHEVIA